MGGFFLGIYMTTQTLFKARIPAINYVFKNGKPAIFIRGRFSTDVQSEIDELNAEIALNHPHIYIDDTETSVESDGSDLVSGLRERLRAELIAEMAIAGSLSNDRGASKDGPIKPASTVDVAVLAAGSGPVVNMANLLAAATGAK